MGQVVHVVSSFKPDGAYDGIIGVYDSDQKVADGVHKAKKDFPGHTFETIEGEVE